jgi:purine-cytosine permease-like protein
VLATAVALALDLTRYQQFLLLLGAFFVPLFGVLLADWLRNGGHYEPEDVFQSPAFRPGMVLAWPHGGIGASLPGFAAAFGLALLLGQVERLVAARPLAVRD